MKKDDLYIAILKHGYDKKQEGATYKSVKEHLENLGYVFNTVDMDQLYHRLFHQVFSHPKGKELARQVNQETICYMEMDAYFNYLEYIELKEARRSSKRATWFATGAIVISIVAMGVSIYFSIKQLKSPTKIETTQFEKIEEWVNKK
jgi:hypothetical protein